jgi:hypothetical protein
MIIIAHERLSSVLSCVPAAGSGWGGWGDSGKWKAQPEYW